MSSPQEKALSAIEEANKALAVLEEGCCRPQRSPRMAQLSATLNGAARALAGPEIDEPAAEAAVSLLQDAGSQIGWLQTGCCAPSRMPLYAEMLTSLSRAQRFVTRAVGGH